MKKSIDISLGICVNVFIFTVWVYKMIISSDIPVNITDDELKTATILLILCLITISFYIRKTRLLLVNILLLIIPLFLWFMSMQQALTYHYHNYDTQISIIGFSVTLILLLQIVYHKVRR